MSNTNTQYNWDVTFDTPNNLMIHTFVNGIVLTSNLNTRRIVLTKNGEVANEFYPEEGYTMEQYHQLVINTAIGAKQQDTSDLKYTEDEHTL